MIGDFLTYLSNLIGSVPATWWWFVFTLVKIGVVIGVLLGMVYWACTFKTGRPFVDIIIVGFISSVLIFVLGLFAVLDSSQRHRLVAFIHKKQ